MSAAQAELAAAKKALEQERAARAQEAQRLSASSKS